MKLPLLFLSAALALGACGREDPSGQPGEQSRIDETRAVEKASDAGKPLTDASLAQIVRSALESESSLDPRRIDIENRQGNVSLNGSVDSEDQREKAGRIAGAVGGVRSVQNNLIVEGGPAAAGATASRKE